MERHYPDIVLTGYAEDVDLVARELASYPGKLHRLHADAASDEGTADLVDAWTDAVVGYVFSMNTGYSAQLKSLFTYLQYRIRSPQSVAILLRGVRPEHMIFPEFQSTPWVSVEAAAEYFGGCIKVTWRSFSSDERATSMIQYACSRCAVS